MNALMMQLLDDLGVTEAVVQAIAARDVLALKSLSPTLPAPPLPMERGLRRATQSNVQTETSMGAGTDTPADDGDEMSDDAEHEEDTDD